MMNEVNITNQNRATRAGGILIEHRRGNDLHTSLVDLLADAMHWCDDQGEDFHFALAQACRHYIHALQNQQFDEGRIEP